MVSQIYRGGGVDPSLLVLASEARRTGWRLWTPRGSSPVSRIPLVRTQVAEQQLVRDQAALEKAERKAEKARNEILDAKATIDARVQQSSALLSQLQAEQQRQLAEELARQQRQQQEQANEAADTISELPKSTTAGCEVRHRTGRQALQSRCGRARGATSGLVKAAWEQAGVTLPHSVQRQYDKTKRVDVTSWPPATSCSSTAPTSTPGSTPATGTSYTPRARVRVSCTRSCSPMNGWLSSPAQAGRRSDAAR